MEEERLGSVRVIRNTLMLIIAIVVGFIIGRIYFLELIPIILSFAIISLVFSFTVIFVSFILNYIKILVSDCKKTGRYHKETFKYLFYSSIGTFLVATLFLTYGILATPFVASIIVGIITFFFIIMIISISSLIDYLIKK